jgi:hypothetical protein
VAAHESRNAVDEHVRGLLIVAYMLGVSGCLLTASFWLAAGGVFLGAVASVCGLIARWLLRRQGRSPRAANGSLAISAVAILALPVALALASVTD